MTARADDGGDDGDGGRFDRAGRTRPHQGSSSVSDRLSTSQTFWRSEPDGLLAALERHNRRIGTWPQRLLHRLFVVYLLGPFSYLALRALFRLEVSGADALDRVGPRAIFVFRHFYEWDPFVTFFGSAWTRALTRPHLHPNSLGGQFWIRTRARRVVSYSLGLLGVARGAGRGQSGLQRARELLASGRPVTVSIAPTGPIGRRREYEIKPGVAFLALDSPDVPVVPITVAGVQELRARHVLALRRPRLAIRFGEPFRAADLDAPSEDARVAAITARIRDTWARLEDGAAEPALRDEEAIGAPAERDPATATEARAERAAAFTVR